MRNLERAEDIAAEAMDAGIDWTWTTFPEFLDRIEALPKGINYASYVGHSVPPHVRHGRTGVREARQ
jgi:N-acyl-D-aspartate/D-glutamate deacylase